MLGTQSLCSFVAKRDSRVSEERKNDESKDKYLQKKGLAKIEVRYIRYSAIPEVRLSWAHAYKLARIVQKNVERKRRPDFANDGKSQEHACSSKSELYKNQRSSPARARKAA